MKYGLELPNGGPCGDPLRLAEFAEVAEAAGWDGVFLEDYIIYYTPDIRTYDPWITLAAMALRTTHIRLGTTVTPLARRRPWKLAREAVTLDHLSKGRFILGVGLGDPHDFTRFGETETVRERAAKLDEGLELLAGFWSGKPFQYHGTYYTVQESVFLPASIQPNHIPVWIGGSSQIQGPVLRSARWDGIVPIPINTPTGTRHISASEVTQLKMTITANRSRTTPFDIAVGGKERDSDWEQEREHIASVAAAGATWWMEGIPAGDDSDMRAAIKRGPLFIA
jgi:alkanesulfonate monooxygenase SsuD/methylene tetrahydromethanopterin reductase-like flavin-dependent oxidoreductase (luciferase family)